MPGPGEIDPAEHRALVEALPQRLAVLVETGTMSPGEATEFLRHARQVLTDRLADLTHRPAQDRTRQDP